MRYMYDTDWRSVDQITTTTNILCLYNFRSETNYSMVVVLQELLTHSQLQLPVTGQGSADESVRVKRKKNKRQ